MYIKIEKDDLEDLSNKENYMLKRTLAGLALVPLLALLVIGGIPLYIAEIVILILAIREFYKAFENKSINPIYTLAYISIVYIGIKNTMNIGEQYLGLIIFILFLCSIIYLLTERKNIVDLAITFLGIFYVVFLIDFIVLTIDNIESGTTYVWTIFIIAFLTDTFAYFAGSLFGKHKLIPKISPKKTVEGSIGGILGSTIGCIIFGMLTNLDITLMIFIGSIGSIIAQIGDLFASAVKRYVGIKDYGKLIPGHGGVLDRFDSVILVAPFVYYIISLFN